MNKIILLIGGNIGNRKDNLKLARDFIQKRIGNIKKVSAVYETEPWGFNHKKSFYNQALEVDTEIGAEVILQHIQKFERQRGKIERSLHYLPRSLDIDILFFNDDVINLPHLVIPHPKIQERNFVLIPLHEILPDYIHPIFKTTVTEMKNVCTDTKWVKKVEEN